MLPDLFVSDLHLAAGRDGVTQTFLRFLASEAAAAGRLFVLGDLFDYWVGDDDGGTAHNAAVIAGLAQAARAGCRVFLMHGNRDFLMGDACAQAMGAQLVPDPLVVDVAGVRTLIAHGDAYCTQDAEYQRFRAMVRSPEWRSEFLAKPLSERRTLAEDMRARSEATKRTKPVGSMDVDPDAIVAAMRAAGCTHMIHGHTHRPACHALVVDGARAIRRVLADWHEGACSYLRCDRGGCRSVPLA